MKWNIRWASCCHPHKRSAPIRIQGDGGSPCKPVQTSSVAWIRHHGIVTLPFRRDRGGHGIRHVPRLLASLSSEGSIPPSKGAEQQNSSVGACVLLVAGTTVGVGMLALPAVTAPAGFLAAATSLTIFCAYTVITGLLVAEVTINFIRQREKGSRGGEKELLFLVDSSGHFQRAVPVSSDALPATSLTSMALTLGVPRPLVILPYLLLHYCVLVAHISKTSVLLSGWVPGLPPTVAAVAFTGVFGGSCFALSQQAMDAFNGVLVAAMMASFLVRSLGRCLCEAHILYIYSCDP